jgi:hypothetical protein
MKNNSDLFHEIRAILFSKMNQNIIYMYNNEDFMLLYLSGGTLKYHYSELL